MSITRSFSRIFIISLTSMLLLWLVLSLLTQQTHKTAVAQTVNTIITGQSLPIHQPDQNIQALASDPEPLGEACGSGEQLPPWVICLHGTVFLLDAFGQATPQDNVPVTITLGGETVTGTTFVHPGQVTPTYGIDISPLDIAFLQPVTLTVSVEGIQIQRQVIVFPNFRTQSQPYDLFVPEVGALDPAPIWGYVVDFAASGPVTGAVVLAEHDGLSVTVTSNIYMTETHPIYSLYPDHLAIIAAEPGDTITLTAYYGGDSDQQVILLDEEPEQVNFVTGWKCDNFDPIPQEGGAGGVPEEGGAGGLPDVACFWGYGLLDGVPIADMKVQLAISETVYEGWTQVYPGEDLPRYGIGLWGGEAIQGSIMTATGLYVGNTVSDAVHIALDQNLSQQEDLQINYQVSALSSIANDNEVNDTLWHDGYLWAATSGGIIRWDPNTGDFIQLTVADGLAANNVLGMAVDANGDFWFGTAWGGVSHYNPNSQTWQTLSTEDGLPHNNVADVAIDSNGDVWMISGGVARYVPTSNTWYTYTSNNSGLPEGGANSITIQNNGDIWFGGNGGGGVRYRPSTNTWVSFNRDNSPIIYDTVFDIEISSNGDIWFGTLAGVSRYTPSTQSWFSFGNYFVTDLAFDSNGYLWITKDILTLPAGVTRYNPTSNTSVDFITTNSDLAHDDVHSVSIGSNGDIWFGTWGGGVSRYNTITALWQTFSLPDPILNNRVIDIAADGEGNLWFATWGGGVSRLYPSIQIWETYTTDDGLAGDIVRTITADANGDPWFATDNGVSHFNLATNSWETFTTTHGLAYNNVIAITLDSDGSLWFGTEGGGVSHYNPDTQSWQTFTTTHGLVNNYVRTIAIDSNNHLWFGTPSGVSHYNPTLQTWETITISSGLASNDVRAIAIQDENTFWFGTQNKGISRYDRTLQQWQTFSTTHGLVHNEIQIGAITIDSHKRVWVGTLYGLSYYDSNTGVWQSFQVIDGLPSHTIRSIYIDQNETIWLATMNGIGLWDEVRHGDLSVSIDSPTLLSIGAQYAYTITIVNDGNRETATVGRITLPISTTYISANIPPSTTTPLSWDLGTLGSGSSVTLVVTATVNPEVLPGTILTARAEASTTSPEAFLSNNVATVETYVRDPYRADTRLSLVGPPVLPPGSFVTYTAQIDNFGGLVATDTVAFLSLPAEIDFVSANPPPHTTTPLSWNVGDLLPLAPPVRIDLVGLVDSAVPANSHLAVSGWVTSTAPESNPLNNSATVTVSTSLTNAQTLILVAPQRLASRYGASPVLPSLYLLAAHPLVQGVVLDVELDPSVLAAYSAWDLNPGSWLAANEVAETIKALIEEYTIAYPNLEYLVFVGGDDILPFYRVVDQNPTMWHERNYTAYVPPSTIRAALGSDRLLTDDFYADRTPLVPDSPFWTDGHSLFLPDFATGRLIETPEEIIATIEAFLVNEGVVSLDPGVVGFLPELTDDLGMAQCNALLADGVVTSCSSAPGEVRETVLAQTSGSSWLTMHSNHFSSSSLTASDIRDRLLPFAQSLLVAFGCHAGLNVPEGVGSLPDLDLVQAFSGQGGTAIGSSAYTYASYISVGYSEALANELTRQLLITNTQTLGDALVQAKHHYYTTHVIAFGYLDEKVLLPVTLYGLPMLQVVSPQMIGQEPNPPQPSAVSMMVGEVEDWTVVTATLENLTYTEHVVADGTYYDYQNQVLAQEQMPVQPAWQLPLTATLNDNQTPHGVVLLQAGYTAVTPFDPLVTQSWALGMSQPPSLAEPQVDLVDWDYVLPYALGYFDPLTETFVAVANLNLVLGAFNNNTQTELLFDDLVFLVLYSDSSDRIKPVVEETEGFTLDGATYLRAVSIDDGDIAQVWGVCDDGVNSWLTVPLTQTGTDIWEGGCGFAAARFYIQAVDGAGNVSVSPWSLSQLYDLELSTPDSDLTANPGQTVSYTLWLSNTGPTTASFSITATEYSWLTTVTPNILPDVAPGGTRQVQVVVAIPSDAAGLETDTVALHTTIAECTLCPQHHLTLQTTANIVYGVTVIPSTSAQTGNPGTTMTYTLYLSNTGNVTDIYTISIAENVWATAAPLSIGPLMSNESIEVNIEVTIPLSVAGGITDTALLIFTSQGNSTVFSTAVLTTTADYLYDLVVTPLFVSQTGNPGATITYTLQITNTGNISDVYSVSAAGHTWTTTTPISVGPLGAGESSEVSIQVIIPTDAAGQNTDTTHIMFTSQGNAIASTSVTLTTTVNNVYDLTVVPLDTTQGSPPGTSAIYILQLTNTGNSPDSYSISINEYTWPITAPNMLGPLVAGESVTITVTVAIPAYASVGMTDSATVMIASQGSQTAFVTIQLTTVATSYKLFLPFIGKHSY